MPSEGIKAHESDGLSKRVAYCRKNPKVSRTKGNWRAWSFGLAC